MGFLKRRKRPTVGLDIGHSSVKGLELNHAGGGLVANRFGTVPIEEAIDSPKRNEAVVEAIRRLFDQADFTTKRTVTGVSGESVIVRVIRMPYFSDQESSELEFAVRGEAQDFIPFDMDEVSFDFQVLGVLDAGAEGRALEVLIVAAQKDLVAWHSEVVRAAGLEPKVVDVGSFALVNAVHYGKDYAPETPVALVDIGSAVTNIAIMKGDSTRFTRDLSTAGSTITRAIMSDLGLDEKDAETAKILHGISIEQEESVDEEMMTISQTNLPDVIEELEPGNGQSSAAGSDITQQVNAICEQFLGEIVSEIKRCLLFYENQLDGQPVDRVFLTGGTMQMANADRYVQRLLDTPAEVLDPFENVGGTIAALDPIVRGATYTTSLGLAMRSVMGGGVT